MAARPGLVRDFNADIHRRLSRTDSERPLTPQEAQEAFEPEGEAMLTRLIAAALAVVVLTPLHPPHPQDGPARTLPMVVPFPAGGPLDVVARNLAQHMGELLGQQ